ncbi:MAG: gliding motility-associated C-terminal domain-containing protein [Chitinophagales bacterium]|nr:gliding motility-associated C-terminal domain-containing protein [Chitinophagales bacterium]
MEKLGTWLALWAIVANCCAQNPMQPKQYNFSTFPAPVTLQATEELRRLTYDSLEKHPEFGVLPHNAQCMGCVELLDKRTVNSRFFVGEGTGGKVFYSQQSYFPLHYQKNGQWMTIDPRLSKMGNFYRAEQQPVPTFLDASTFSSGVVVNDQSFEFNRNLTLSFLDGKLPSSIHEPIADHASIGVDGVYIKDYWPGIDMQQVFKKGTVKTTFIIPKPLTNLPSNGDLTITDYPKLPQGYRLELVMDSSIANKTAIVVTNGKEKPVEIYKPVYYDSQGRGGKVNYNLVSNGLALSISIPITVLNDTTYEYPFYIDPEVVGKDDTGHYVLTGQPSAVLGFSLNPQSCDYPLTVICPGKSELTDTYLQLEYENNRVNICQGAFCQFNDVSMEVIGPCGNGTGQLSCNPAAPPFIGTCTTDENLVPAADSIRIPNFLPCFPPQCPDYVLNFTLKNRQFRCTGGCGFDCAEGKYFAVTVKGRLLEDTIRFVKPNGQQDRVNQDTTVCAGQPVTLVANPDWGVPPYNYLWNTGQTDSVIIVRPEQTSIYNLMTSGQCDTVFTNDIIINVIPSPVSNGTDTVDFCEGDAITQVIGGPPAAGVSYDWTANPATALSFLSTTILSQPQLSIPAGQADNFTYFLTADDGTCTRVDTVRLLEHPLPNPIIVPDSVIICEGSTAQLSTSQTYAQYQWNTGENLAVITIGQAGSFAVTVTDDNGCTAAALPVNATVNPVPQFEVYTIPDSSILIGESVTLNASIDLNAANVNSFLWSPNDGLSCNNCAAPVATPENDQWYYLQVTSAGCIGTDSVLVDIVFPDNYWIPNAFSPNDDKKNDRFYIKKQSGVTVLEFKVYNRWGELVHDGAEPWDGTYNNEKAPIEVYTYYFKLRFYTGKEETAKGNVTLLR